MTAVQTCVNILPDMMARNPQNLARDEASARCCRPARDIQDGINYAPRNNSVGSLNYSYIWTCSLPAWPDFLPWSIPFFWPLSFPGFVFTMFLMAVSRILTSAFHVFLRSLHVQPEFPYDFKSKISRGFAYPNEVSNISLYQTGPNRDYTRGSYRGIGQQYFRGNSGRSDTHYPDSFHNVSQAHVTSADSSAAMMEHSIYASGNAAQWSSDFVPEGGVEMSRWASQSSFHSGKGSVHGTDSSDHPTASQLQQSYSQMSFPLLSGNTRFEDDSNGAGLYSSNSTVFEDFTTHHEESSDLFSNIESFGNDAFGTPGSQHRTSVSEDSRFGLFSSVSKGNPAMEGHLGLIPSTISEASFSTSSLLSDQPPYGWDCGMSYQDSAQNSPVFAPNETWSNMPVVTQCPSPREEPTSDFRRLSPRNSRKPVIPGVLRESPPKHIEPEVYHDPFLDDSFPNLARQSVELDNIAREHPYYQNPVIGPDGLYHCPWEGETTCQHKAEKLKCNYDKFVDSHLKPYRCKVPQCENARFSSTACLLRHEREAHAMHGHGDKPFLCTHEGCERGVLGNGFPRHWNLRDHMKRVHNDTGPAPRSNASGSPTPSHAAPATRAPRKRKNDALAQDKEPAAKKTQTSSVAAPSPPPSQQQQQTAATSEELSLVQQWQQRKIQLLKLVEQLDDPRDPKVLQVLTHAGKELQVLAGTSKRINNAPAMKRTMSQRSTS